MPVPRSSRRRASLIPPSANLVARRRRGRDAPPADHGRDVDDVAAPLPPHEGQRGLARGDRGDEVQLEELAELGGRGVLEAGGEAASRVVDEHVHRPEPRGDLVHHGAKGLLVGDVERVHGDLGAAPAELGGDRSRAGPDGRAQRASRMPAPAKARAVAAPIPAEAPVTMATRPAGSATRGADGAGDAVAVARDPAVGDGRDEPGAGQAEERGDPSPAAQAAQDFRQRGGAAQHATVREHELDGLEAGGLRDGG